MIPVFDSDIIIDCLQKKQEAYDELSSYKQRYISIISWIEVMVGAKSNDERWFLENFLQDNFILQQMTMEIAIQAADIRRHTRLKLPDAIIWATAKAHNALLVTRNSRDFPKNDPAIRIPYTLT